MLGRYMRVLVLSLLVLSLASPGFAARRSSLGGNLLIKDTDEIFFFPQRVSEYNRLVTFDLGSSNGLGSGGMIFGSERAVFGAFVHRSDFLTAVPNAFFTAGDIDNIGNAGASSSGGPFQWFDVLLGWEGGGNPWGIRVSVGRDQDDPPGDDNSDVTSVNAVVGVSVRNIDISGEFSIASAESEVAGSRSDNSPFAFAVAARKTAMEQSEDLQLGWLGMFAYQSGGPEVTPAGGMTTTTDQSELDLVVGLGPVYTPSDRTTVAMYGTFEYLRAKSEPGVVVGGSTKESFTDYVIPGWHVAGEFEVASWLQARVGLESDFTIATREAEFTAPAPKEETQDIVFDFRWHTGIGVNFGNFQIDGYIDPSVITSGTDLLGESTDLFGMVTASYSF